MPNTARSARASACGTCSPLNKWEFRGPDALEAVQRVHTNDVIAMRSGQVRYGAFVDEDGLLVDDGTVFVHAPDHLWVCTNGNEHEGYFGEATKGLDVAFRYIAPELPSMQIQGPKSRDLVRSLTDAPIDDLRYFTFFPQQVAFGGVPVWLSRTGFSGELGYEVFLRPEHAETVWAAVEGAGAIPVRSRHHRTDPRRDRHDRHRLRLRRRTGVRRSTSGWTAWWRSRAPASSWARRRFATIAVDPPNRLKTIRLADGPLPEYGAAVFHDGNEVGVLTSPATSPLYGNLGLAILRTGVAVDGTQVEVAAEAGRIAGAVDVLAIHDPEKRRPRG